MDMTKLKYFTITYREMSLTLAAKECGISKPALSLAIKSLEESLETKLFTRTNKSMLPTAKGNELYQEVLPLLSQLKDIEFKIKTRSKFAGKLRIGAPICFSDDFLMSYIKDFQKKYPDITFELLTGNGKQVYDFFYKGKVDLAIIGDDFAQKLSSSFHKEKLLEFKLMMVSSKKYYDKNIKDKHLTPDLLSNLDWLFQDHVSDEDWLMQNCSKKIQRRKALVVNNHHLHIKSLIESMGVGLQADYSISKYIKKGQLVTIGKNAQSYNFYAVLHNSQIPTQVMKHFLIGIKNCQKN